MDDRIEAWVQEALEMFSDKQHGNIDELAAHLRTKPEGFVLVPTKLSRAMEAVLENEKGAYQTGDDLYADLIAASQESGT